MKKPTEVLYKVTALGFGLDQAYNYLEVQARLGLINFDFDFEKTIDRPDRYMKIIKNPEGDLIGIPSLSCLESHLPRERLPTREELNAAWEACYGRLP